MIKDKEKTKEDSDNPKDALGANLGTDVGTTSRAARMLKAGQIGSSLGKSNDRTCGYGSGIWFGAGSDGSRLASW